VSAKVRVFLADDHSVVRHGVRQLLASDEGIVIVGEASDGAEVLRADLGECDVLVLDLSLPRYSGIEVLRRVRERYPALRVVVLSMYPADQYRPRLLAEGAAAYVAKDSPAEELAATLREVARGRTAPPPPPAAGAAAAGATEKGSFPHDALTAREYQVFTLLAEGKRVSDVATELDVSASTVSNHVAHIKEKLGAASIGAIVAYAHRIGLVD
jgi:DNA-binding NarL/FixJ family response regulator